MCLLVVYEHGHLAINTYTKYAFIANYDTNFIIQVVHIISHVLKIMYMSEIKDLWNY